MKHPDERGQSVTVFVAVAVMALLAVCGLVVDGGQQVAATRQAQMTAQDAARSGADAALTARLQGGNGEVAARSAAQKYLAVAGMTGHVSVSTNQVQVDTEVRRTTVFLSLIGITHVVGRGQAVAASQATR